MKLVILIYRIYTMRSEQLLDGQTAVQVWSRKRKPKKKQEKTANLVVLFEDCAYSDMTI